MKFQNLSAKIFRSIGIVTAASLLAGLFTATAPSAAAATVEPYQDQPFLISSSAPIFYADDVTPRIGIDAMPNNLPAGSETYFIDVTTQKTFYVGGGTEYRWPIPRFFKEKSKKFKVVIAPSVGSSGGVTMPVSEIPDAIAESNEITIERGPWELRAIAPSDHTGPDYWWGYRNLTIQWETNQPINMSSIAMSDFRAYYDVFFHNLITGQISSTNLTNYGALGGASTVNGVDIEETARYQVYIAKRGDVSSVDQLEDIQAVSQVLVTPPRKWGIKLGAVENTQYSTLFKVPFTSTRYISSSKYSLFVEDSATGKIICGDKNPEAEGRTFLHCGPTTGPLVAYIASATQPNGSEYASQLQEIVASSKDPYPVDFEAVSSDVMGGRFQNGSNPSTADCQQQCYGDPVNTLNGELFENELDLQVEGAIGLNFVRSYSTLRGSELGPFGHGTTFSYNMGISGDKPNLDDSTQLTVKQENGSTVGFSAQEESGTKTYSAPNDFKATLSGESSGNYVFTRTQNQERFIFNPSGRLLQISDRLGNEVSLNYTTAGKLSSVSNGTSTVEVNWTGELISSISDGSHTVGYEYASDNLIKVTNSKITTPKLYSYYPDGKVQNITHPNGGVYETTYDAASGRVATQIDPRGGVTSFSYEKVPYTSDYTTTITLPTGDKTREYYSSTGQLTGRTFAYGTPSEKSHGYEYSSAGELVAERLPGNRTISYRYDSRGNLIYLSNPSGKAYRFEYNALNLLIRTINPAGKASTNEYDSSGVLLKSVGYDGAVTSYTHNSKGMLTGLKDPNGQKSGLSSSYEYNSSDLLNSTTDTRGKVTSYSYDANRNPAKITDALGNETEFSYANGNAALVEEIRYDNGSIESFSYDGAGRRVESVAKDGNSTQYGYDSMDNLLTVTDRYGTTINEYDANQKLISTTNPKGAKTSYEYNALGLLVKTITPNGQAKLKEYGVDSMPTAEVDASGNRTLYHYGYDGNLERVTDPAGGVTQLGYDALGQLTSKDFPSGNWISYSYSPAGQLKEITEGRSSNTLRTTKQSYDASGNLTKTTYGDGTTELRSYDSEGNLKEVTDREGEVTAYSYDGLNRVFEEVRPDGSEITNSYDSVGKMISSDYGNGEIYENSYNLKDQLLESTTPEGLTTEYGYNPAGELTSRGPPLSKTSYEYSSFGEITSVSYPSGTSVDYSYDSLGNLQEVKHGTETLASYSYDGRYNLTGSSYGNGITDTTEFDALNRVKGITVANGASELYSRDLSFNADSQISKADSSYGGGLKQSRSYQYSGLGTISSVKDELTGQSQSYGYDLLSNLKTLGSDSFDYSAASSKLSQATVGGIAQSYSYDGRGNRTELTSTSKTVAYSWTKSNLLEEVELSPTKTVGYGYDSAGLLSSRSVNGGAEEKFSWDTVSGSIPVLIEDNDFDYVYGAESTPFLQIKKSTGEETYLHGDERNSVVLATDEAGEALWHRDYDEYGSRLTQTPASDTAAAVETRFGYAGEYLDPDTGLYNLRARWYDPETAGFLSVDPALLGTSEAYSYASGNPLSNTDPLGLWSMKDTGTSVAAAVDGFIGFPIGSTIANAISPGSIDNCSALYIGVGAVAMVGSMFVPGLGAAKIVGKVASGVVKLAKSPVASKFSSNIKAAFPQSMHPDSGSLGSSKPDLVYRALAPGENPKLGLHARAPGIYERPISHVAGLTLSPWISTSKSLDLVKSKYDGGNGIVSIDLNRISTEIQDISGGFKKGGMFTNYAKKDQEVLIRDHIPLDAIVDWWR